MDDLFHLATGLLVLGAFALALPLLERLRRRP